MKTLGMHTILTAVENPTGLLKKLRVNRIYYVAVWTRS